MRVAGSSNQPRRFRLVAKRSARQGTLLTAVAVTVLMSVGLASAILGLSARQPAAALENILRTGSAVDTSLSETMILTGDGSADDIAAQDATVRETIAANFPGLPVQVTRTASTGDTTAAQATWTITLDPARVRVADLDALIRGTATVKDAIVDSSAADLVNETGRLPRTLVDVRQSIAAVDSLSPVPLAILLAATIVALVLFVRLLSESRRSERELLRLRGASAITLPRLDLIESVVLAAIAAVLGTVAAQLLLGLAFPGSPTVAELIPVPIAIVAAGAISAVSAFLDSRPPAPGRRRPVLLAAVTVLLAAFAGITFWRFTSYTAGGAPDPIGTIAPAALLCTLAAAALILLPFIARAIEHAVLRSDRLALVFAARSASRDLTSFAAVIVLLCLAVGSVTVAASFNATSSRLIADSSVLINGADTRAQLTVPTFVGSEADLVDMNPVLATPGVTNGAPVLAVGASSGELDTTLTAVAASRLSQLTDVSPTTFDAATVTRQLGGGGVVGMPLPQGTSTLTLTATASGNGLGLDKPTVAPTVWVSDDYGQVFPADGIAHTIDGKPHEVSIALPNDRDWAIVAIDLHVHAPASVSSFSYVVDAITAGSATILPPKTPWVVAQAPFGIPFLAAPNDAPLGVSLGRVQGTQLDTTAVRMVPPKTDTVPVVISEALADAAGLKTGDETTLRTAANTVAATIAGTVASVPGTDGGSAVLADRARLSGALLTTSQQVPRSTEIWVSTTGSAATDARLQTLLGSTTAIIPQAAPLVDRFAATSSAALWLGAGLCLLLALLALATSLPASRRHRMGETRALRSLGVSARAQANGRLGEAAAVVLYALVAGLVVGLIVAALVVPQVSRLSVPIAPAVLPITLLLGIAAVGAVVAVTVVVVAIALLRHRWIIARSAGGTR